MLICETTTLTYAKFKRGRVRSGWGIECASTASREIETVQSKIAIG